MEADRVAAARQQIDMLQPKTNGSPNSGFALSNQEPTEIWPEIRQRALDYRFDPQRDVTRSPSGLGEPDRVTMRDVGGQAVGDSRPQTGYGTGRITGPVALINSISQKWRLSDAQLAILLGYDAADARVARQILNGHIGLRGRDQKDRIAYLIAIYGILHRVFKDPAIAYQWLNERKEMLEGDSPLARMLKGSMEDMLLTRQAVENLAGS